MIRAFFAITLEEAVKQTLLGAIQSLKESLPISVKWTKEKQLHLTLEFLGSMTSDQMRDLIKSVDLSDFLPFILQFESFLALPSEKPRVIGLGIHLGKELSALAQTLRAKLVTLGLSVEERAFLPHITLGRLTKPRRRLILFPQAITPLSQQVTKLTLIESQLSPEGSHYAVLHEYPLGK